MKKLFFILSLLFVTAIPLLAQEDDDNNEGGEKIRDKMTEYVQKRLDLSKSEAEKFTPLFLRYFREWRQTLRDNRTLPALDRQQKIIELRVRYRSQFREIIGEQKSNQVFGHQDDFIRILLNQRAEQRRNNPGQQPPKRPRVNKLL
ncbi:MAG TPA: hypothetical protein VIZ28_14930 [Chitinophagaceae bacterium]